MTRLPLPTPATAIALGAALQLWLWSRAWLYWDQILLLRLGMSLVLDGELAVFAKVMSGGGVLPGCLLQLLVAAPLSLWFDYRSPGLVVVVFHLAAGVILWRTVEAAAGRRVAAIFLAVYWLSPWRLYHSGFIWEPNYLLLPGALHLWACWHLRPVASRDARSSRAASLILGAVLIAAPQLHASGVVLLVATAFLAVRARIRPRWLIVGGGGALATLPLVPTAIGAMRAPLPALAQGSLGDLGFVEVGPLVRPLIYWFRLPSAEIGRRLRQTVFWSDAEPPTTAGEAGLHLLQATCLASVLLVVVASVWLWRRRSRGALGEGDGFLAGYAFTALLSLVVSAGLSMETLQGWHALVLLHGACLPVALWIAAHEKSDRTDDRAVRRWRLAIALFLLLRLPVVLVVGLGHPMYRAPTDPASRARVAPENLPEIELERIPFGSGKESEGPAWRSIPLR